MHTEPILLKNLISTPSPSLTQRILMLRLCFSLLLSLSPLLALNGLTNLSSEEMLGVLGEVAHSASGEDGFDAPLSLYNNEENTKGYAYSEKGSEKENQWNKEGNKGGRNQKDNLK